MHVCPSHCTSLAFQHCDVPRLVVVELVVRPQAYASAYLTVDVALFAVPGHSSIPDGARWGPAVVPGFIPDQAIFSNASVAALASLNDFAGNFGHALFDFLFPVFNILHITGDHYYIW